MGKSISFVLPAYNEEENIERAATAALEVAESLGLDDYEVIVVNDGSRDGTGAIIDHMAAGDSHVRPIHHPQNKGYAEALKTGFTNPPSPR